jgi:hypothetical protein
MEKEPAGFFQRKTTWAALGSIATGAAGYATKSMSLMEALSLVFNGLMALGVRSAIAKTDPPQKTIQAAPVQDQTYIG